MALTITKPGAYRQRNGRKAIVKGVDGDGGWPIYGLCDVRTSGQTPVTWATDGLSALPGEETDWDIVAPWKPLRPKPKRKAGWARWGVWVPCTSREQARSDAAHINANRIPVRINGKDARATIRRSKP